MDESKPRWKPLGHKARRILGVMIEKAKTTPNAYPLTLNSLTTGCNQKSNREPTMNLEEEEVEDVCEELRGLGALVQVEGSGRVSKYRHNLYDWFGVERVELSILGELLLRGAQTVGDLRQRASRMDPINSLDELATHLASLQAKGLVEPLSPPGRGQVVAHAIYPPDERLYLRKRLGLSADASFGGFAPGAGNASESARPIERQDASAPRPAAPTPPATPSVPVAREASSDRVSREEFEALAQKVAELEATVDKLSDTIRSIMS